MSTMNLKIMINCVVINEIMLVGNTFRYLINQFATKRN